MGRSQSRWTGGIVFVALAILSAAALLFVHFQGWTLYYGDADAHQMIARRIVDSQNPGVDQIGSGWLPLPNLLMLPFVGIDAWWRSGIAGAIPAAICFVVGGCFFFAAVRRIFDSEIAGLTALALFALNPNILYLQSIPMTEVDYFASLAAVLYFTVRFDKTQGRWCAVGAGVAACAGSLMRYEGWFVLPFVAAYFWLASRKHRWPAPLLFCIFAGLGPLAWLAHNWWMTGHPLDFFLGPYSPAAIQGSATYPGRYNWRVALIYWGTACRVCASPALVVIGLAGMVVCLFRRVFWPLFFLTLPPIFYVASMHSGSTPIFIPSLWPHSHYNVRYGTAAAPLLALAAAALVTVIPMRRRTVASAVVILIGLGYWAIHFRPADWPVWQESNINDADRRERIRQTAAYLEAHYVPGSGIITSFYPLTSIFREMGLPLRGTLTGDNGLPWLAAVQRPEFFLKQEWAVVEGGDQVQSAINRLGRFGVTYHLEKQIIVGKQPVLEIYRR